MEDIGPTLADVLHIEAIASVIIHFLELKDKRSLRLVAHAGKDAVDKTITAVDSAFAPRFNDNHQESLISTLVNANWKGVKNIAMISYPVKPDGLFQIAEAGFSKLESLALYPIIMLSSTRQDTEVSAKKVIDAGWKLKELKVCGSSSFHFPPPLSWFEMIMREVQWPLESLFMMQCTEDMAAIIGKSNWPLKDLELGSFTNELSSETIEQLMKASWMATVESLDLSSLITATKGTRALVEGICRAVNLQFLNIQGAEMTTEEALILGEGSYPKLKKLVIKVGTIGISGLTAILKACPALEYLEPNNLYATLLEPLEDPEDAKTIGQHMRMFKHLNLTMFQPSQAAACSLLSAHDWAQVESLILGNGFDIPPINDVAFDDEVIAALVQHDWPCLRKIKLVVKSIIESGVTAFSAKEWPVLEDLELYVEQASRDITLDSKKLPHLKTLKLDCPGGKLIAPSLLGQVWPHLETLSLMIDPDIQYNNWTIYSVLLKGIKHAHMPNLKVLMLNAFGLSIREQGKLQQEARRIGYVEIEWENQNMSEFPQLDELSDYGGYY